jgi:hypothetical protein
MYSKKVLEFLRKHGAEIGTEVKLVTSDESSYKGRIMPMS